MSALPSEGSTLGKYRVVSEIGRGGMGVVYKGHDPALDRLVAIKVLAPHLAWEEQFVTRFLREAKAAARLKHTGIVTIYDVGQEGAWYYYVMEYLEGGSLTTLMSQRGPLSGAEVIQILRPLAEALDYAHQSGLVHRDIKPSNIIVGHDGRVTLTDFGIAHAAQEPHLTAAGHTVGSPAYMSPEQAQSQPIDARTDQYSLAVVAFELLGGKVPFQGDSSVSLLYKVVHEPVPSICSLRPELPRAVDQVLEKALSKDPTQRYAQVTSFVEALAQALLGQKDASPAFGQKPLQLGELATLARVWGTSAPTLAVGHEAERPTAAGDGGATQPTPAAGDGATLPHAAVDDEAALPALALSDWATESAPAGSVAAPPADEPGTGPPGPMPGAQGQEEVPQAEAPVDKGGLPIGMIAGAFLSLVALIAIIMLFMRSHGTPGQAAASASPTVPFITKVVTSVPLPTVGPQVLAGQWTSTPSLIPQSSTTTPPATPMPSPTSTARPADMPIPTSIPSPTASVTWPALTPTPTPSRTPIRAPTRTPTRAPTRTPTPMAPVGLLSPDDGTRFPRDSSILLSWTSVGDLAGDGCYVVTVTYTKDGQTVTDDEKWVQTTSWDLAEHNYLPGLSDDGYFYWSVQVRHRDGGVNGTGPGTPLNQSSATWSLFWGRGPKPTATPSAP